MRRAVKNALTTRPGAFAVMSDHARARSVTFEVFTAQTVHKRAAVYSVKPPSPLLTVIHVGLVFIYSRHLWGNFTPKYSPKHLDPT